MLDTFMEEKQREKKMIDELIEFYKLYAYGADKFLKEKAEELKAKYEFTLLGEPSSNTYLKRIKANSLPSKEEAKKTLKELYQRKELLEDLFEKDSFKTHRLSKI